MSTTNSETPSSPEGKWTAYLDGKLSAQDAAAFEREHPEAAAEHVLHARIANAVRLHSPPPKMRNADFFNERILAEISSRAALAAESSVSAKRRLWPLWRLAAAAACCLLAGLVIYGTSASRPGPDPEPSGQRIASVKVGDETLSVTVLDANGKKVVWINDLEQLSSEYVLR